MKYLDLTLPTPEENLALDEAELVTAESSAGHESLRLWELDRPCVVLGKNCRVRDDVYVERCRSDHIPVMRRCSGGGTVLLGPGCLCFTLILRYDRDPRLRDVTGSYRLILHRIANALEHIRPVLQPEPSTDLALHDLKVGGNAQQRKLECLMHQGCLLLRFDVELIARYLRLPERQPTYRRQRPHHEFVTNLGGDAATIRQRLRDAWQATEPPHDWARDMVRRLVAEKYGTREWNFRR